MPPKPPPPVPSVTSKAPPPVPSVPSKAPHPVLSVPSVTTWKKSSRKTSIDFEPITLPVPPTRRSVTRRASTTSTGSRNNKSLVIRRSRSFDQGVPTRRQGGSALLRKGFTDFTLCIRGLPKDDMQILAFDIFTDLEFTKDFKLTRPLLTRFIMRVEAGYRLNLYHNWHHAVSVAHFVFVLLKKTNLVARGQLTKLEAFSLVVSAIAHDIDHRGTNNQYQAYTNSEFHKLYGALGNTMERHHLAYTRQILDKPETNLIFTLDPPEYKYFMELLSHNIIATDLSLHMKTRNDLFVDCHGGTGQRKKKALLSLIMTAADLSDNCKKWDDNIATVKSILEEFFAQGDSEIRLGYKPMNMMNRHEAYIPLIEYKFTKYVCAPVFTFLSAHYDGLASVVANIANNENLWTLSTTVFDLKKNKKVDNLEILDSPEMTEAALKAIGSKMISESLEDVKKRKFSAPMTLLDETDLENVDTSGMRKNKFFAWFGGLFPGKNKNKKKK